MEPFCNTFRSMDMLSVGWMTWSRTMTRASMAATRSREIRLVFLRVVIIAVSPFLYLVGGLLTEQAGGLEDQNDYQQRKGECVGEGGQLQGLLQHAHSL